MMWLSCRLHVCWCKCMNAVESRSHCLFKNSLEEQKWRNWGRSRNRRSISCGENLPVARRKSQQAKQDQAEVLSLRSEVLFQKQLDEMGRKTDQPPKRHLKTGGNTKAAENSSKCGFGLYLLHMLPDGPLFETGLYQKHTFNFYFFSSIL